MMVPAAHRGCFCERFSIDNCQTGSAALQKPSGLAWEMVSAVFGNSNFYAIYLHIVYNICSIFLALN